MAFRSALSASQFRTDFGKLNIQSGKPVAEFLLFISHPLEFGGFERFEFGTVNAARCPLIETAHPALREWPLDARLNEGLEKTIGSICGCARLPVFLARECLVNQFLRERDVTHCLVPVRQALWFG